MYEPNQYGSHGGYGQDHGKPKAAFIFHVFIKNQNKKSAFIRQNKKIYVFWVTGLKILGRVGTHIFFLIIFFSGKI